MKVLHLISSAGMYGAEAVILTLLQEMRRIDQAAVLGVFLNQANPNTALYDAARSAGIESHLLPCRGQVDRGTVREIRDLVSATGADVVHTHGYKADVYGYVALRKSSATLVSTCHNWCDTDLATRFYGALDRFCLRQFVTVAAVSEEVKQRLVLAGLRPERVPVIRNGIDAEPFLTAHHSDSHLLSADAQSRPPLTVGFAGRLSGEKGIDLFLQAAEGVLKKFPMTRFVVAGDGEERPAVEHTLRERALSRDVTLLGRCEDMGDFYASVDVLLSSSRTEGLPVALMEAMASGVPVVATAVGDVPTLVENHVTGLLVPSLDVPAMVEAAGTLLGDHDLCKRLGEAGRRRVQEGFSAERMAESYVGLYQHAMQSSMKNGSPAQ